MLTLTLLLEMHRYLDYIEEKKDIGMIIRLYERCLVACASYPGTLRPFMPIFSSHQGSQFVSTAASNSTCSFQWLVACAAETLCTSLCCLAVPHILHLGLPVVGLMYCAAMLCLSGAFFLCHQLMCSLPFFCKPSAHAT